MKITTIEVMYDDYKEYQEWHRVHHGWDMKETFSEYVQRCIDNDELYLIEEESE